MEVPCVKRESYIECWCTVVFHCHDNIVERSTRSLRGRKFRTKPLRFCQCPIKKTWESNDELDVLQMIDCHILSSQEANHLTSMYGLGGSNSKSIGLALRSSQVWSLNYPGEENACYKHSIRTVHAKKDIVVQACSIPASEELEVFAIASLLAACHASSVQLRACLDCCRKTKSD